MGSRQQDGSLLKQTPTKAAIQQAVSNLIEGTTQPTTSKNKFVSVAVPLSNSRGFNKSRLPAVYHRLSSL